MSGKAITFGVLLGASLTVFIYEAQFANDDHPEVERGGIGSFVEATPREEPRHADRQMFQAEDPLSVSGQPEPQSIAYDGVGSYGPDNAQYKQHIGEYEDPEDASLVRAASREVVHLGQYLDPLEP